MIKINHLGFSFFSNMSRRTQDAEKAAVIKSIMSNTKPKPWEYTDSISAAVDCNEVYDNLFIGDKNAAKNKRFLKKIGITHVVNAAEGHSFGMVNTDADFYKDINIKYLGLCLMDLSVTNVAIHFEEVADFIDKALLKGGRVLVHCVMGLSRSAIFSLAFLVMKRGMSACSAMAFIRRRRDINPNDGFIYQLAALDNKIGRKQTNYI